MSISVEWDICSITVLGKIDNLSGYPDTSGILVYKLTDAICHSILFAVSMLTFAIANHFLDKLCTSTVSPPEVVKCDFDWKYDGNEAKRFPMCIIYSIMFMNNTVEEFKIKRTLHFSTRN